MSESKLVRVHEDAFKLLEKISEQEGLPMSSVISTLIKQRWKKQYEKGEK